MAYSFSFFLGPTGKGNTRKKKSKKGSWFHMPVFSMTLVLVLAGIILALGSFVAAWPILWVAVLCLGLAQLSALLPK